MEFSQIALNQGQAFLAWTTGVVVLVVGIFLTKLLIDLSTLAKNLNETSLMVNTELKPTIEEVKKTLESVNSIIANTNNGVDNFKNIVEKTFGKTKAFTETVFGGLIKGFITTFKIFSKR